MTVSIQDSVEDFYGYRLRAMRSGAGPVVLFLHGFGVTADMWRPNLQAVAEAGYSVLALVLPGHGGSFRPKKLMGVTDLARVILTALDAEGADEICMVGNSLGGAVASEMALLQPHRFKRLVLENALGFGAHIPVFQKRNYWTHLLLPGALAVFTGRDRWAFKRLYQMIYYAPETVPPGVMVLRHASNWWDNHWGRALVMFGVLRQMLTHGQRQKFARRRAKLQTPTLIIWGENDQMLPVEHARQAQALIPSAQLHIFAHCGHAPNIEYAEDFNRKVLEFLK